VRWCLDLWVVDKMAGRAAQQRRMAKRKIEVLESYLRGDRTTVPLLSSMGLREVNEQMVRIKLAQLNQRILP
jgi:hypothetical protein